MHTRQKEIKKDSAASARRRSLQFVRQFYDVGCDSLERHPPPRLPYRGVKREAKRAKVHPEMLRKARVFAQSYTPNQVDQLLNDCRRLRYSLGVSHVLRMLSIRDPAKRDALQEQAVRGRWSYSRLEDEILKELGIRSPAVGRLRRAPADSHEGCLQLARFCEKWRRISEALRQPTISDKRKKSKPITALLPAPIGRQLDSADKVLTVLGGLVNAELERLIEKKG